MAELLDSLLKIANSPVLQQFLHDCVDDLIGAKQANFDNYNSDIEWTTDDFYKAKICVQKFYREAVIDDGFRTESDLDSSLQEKIKNCYEIRKGEIFQALIKENLVKNGHNLVENFDWKLKWVLGSSKLASVREPLLQIDFHCLKQKQDEDKLVRNTVNFEVNLEKLDILIEQLKRLKTEIVTE